MGQLKEVHCPACGYREVFRLGCGRKDYDLKQIYTHFGLMDTWDIKVAVLEKKPEIIMFRYRLGKCADCGRLQAVPEVLLDNGDTCHGHFCPCAPEKEHEIHMIEEKDEAQIACPACGQRLQTADKGLWD
ncbi:MAG: hypothetical protein ACI4AD_02725 [Roseburia sp.]